MVRDFTTDAEKREHVIKLNLARRQLEPWQWGKAFIMMLEERGVKRGQGSRNDNLTSETVSEVAFTLGVDDRTARNRLAAADAFDALPAEKQEQVRTREKAKERQGERSDLNIRDNCPTPPDSGRARDIVAAKVGFGSGGRIRRE